MGNEKMGNEKMGSEIMIKKMNEKGNSNRYALTQLVWGNESIFCVNFFPRNYGWQSIQGIFDLHIVVT